MDDDELEKSKAAIRSLIVDRAEKEYKILSDTYDMIDRKSQAMTTIAGIFLAVVFSFASRIGVDTNCVVLILVFNIQIIFLISVGCAIAAMFARETKDPPSGKFCDDKHEVALEFKDVVTIRQYIANAHKACMNEWHEANRSVERCNAMKANWPRASQISLLLAAVLTTALTITVLVKPDLMPLKNQEKSLNSSSKASQSQ